MLIRKFKNEDARKVSNLIRKCLVEVNSKDYPKNIMDGMVKHFTPSQIIKNSEERNVFVAVEDDKVLGTASIKDDVILTVFVNPNIHGKGIGSKLMNKVEELAKKKGYKTVKLPSSLTSYEFYKKRGYKKVKMLHSDKYGDTIEMKKRL
jgi:N-acetylglutamate synthase-like GNAT family acetyltransferase